MTLASPGSTMSSTPGKALDLGTMQNPNTAGCAFRHAPSSLPTLLLMALPAQAAQLLEASAPSLPLGFQDCNGGQTHHMYKSLRQ